MIAYLAFVGDRQMDPNLEGRTVAVLAAAICLPGINYVGLLIQNGAALLFPAWVHLGSGRPGGVEALGQNMLVIVAYAALLGIALALPAALAAGVLEGLENALGWWAGVPASVVLLGGAALEAVLLLRWLGKVFETTDPAETGIAA